MTFINWILLGGAMAFSVPLIIHLFNRSRFRVVNWGAMHLLENVVRVNRKRIRLEQLILLLIRCAIPVLLALCLARPVITGWRSLVGNTPASVVMLLDNSYSMSAGQAAETQFQRARSAVDAIFGRLQKGSDASVVLMGGEPEPLFDRPSFDPPALVEQLREMKALYGAVNVGGSLEKGLEVIGDMNHAKRDVVLVSDFRRQDWQDLSALERIRELHEGMDVKPSLTLVNVGAPITDNVSVQSIEIDRLVAGVGQRLRVRANLENHGSAAYDDLRVYFRADGRQEAASQIALGSKETAQVLFTCSFDTAGSHVIEVEAEAPDLKMDNTAIAAVPVLDRIGVLVVDGDPSPKPLQGESDFLQIALTPFKAGRAKLSDLFEARALRVEELNPAAVEDIRVVVLANVPRLTDAQVELLQGFVRAGGGLMVVPGDRIDVAWYNRKLGRDAGLLPMTFEGTAGSIPDVTQHTEILAQHFDHAALEHFNDRRHGNLSDARIWRWYRLGESAVGQATVMARLGTADPVLAERRFGDGSVIQWATACDADWSNLPMRPIYLPLVQQLVVSLASNMDPPRNVNVGEPLVALLPRKLADARLNLIDPDGRVRELRARDNGTRAVVEFTRTRRPGLYTLRLPGSGDGASPDGPPGADASAIHFVVRAERNESDLEPLDEESLAAVAEALGATVVDSGEAYLELDRTRRHGREVWRWLWLAVLAFLFGELLLQQWFARGRG